MNDANAIKNAILTSSDGVFDSLLQTEIDAGKSRHDGMANVLIKAVEARYGANGRAMKHMRHFLAGTGAEMHVSMSELLREDRGAHARLSNEVLRRANGIMTDSEKKVLQDSSRMSAPNNIRPDLNAQRMSAPVNIDPVITLFQKTFEVEDWAGALGTFPISWELIACPATKTTPLTVLLRGMDEYHWHPEDGRLTRRLHQFAEELAQSGKAKTYMMTTGWVTMLVNQLNGEIMRAGFATQTNPDNNSLSEFFTLDQGSLLGQAALQGAKRSVTRFMKQFR